MRSFDNASAYLGDDTRYSKRELWWEKCSDCTTGKPYDSTVDALRHISDKHITHTKLKVDPVNRPFDDPSLCWIRLIGEAPQNELRKWPGYWAIRDFLDEIVPISNLCEDLFYYVARSRKTSSGNQDSPSLLPTALTTAFCGILSSYINLGRTLSLINRAGYISDEGKKAIIREKIDHTDVAITNSLRLAFAHLEKARLDIIILCKTHREVDCLRVQSVDMHLLALAFVQNVQKFALPGGQGKDDLVHTYQKYLSVLRGRASRRPQRRVFLDIQGFQEELDALKSLTDTQLSVAEKFLSLLYPGSFHETNTGRVEKYSAEYELWKKLDKQLQDRWDELENLTHQSRRVKDDVKQAIEILEEDHGKAIRVFTVVTLFFLPLSVLPPTKPPPK